MGEVIGTAGDLEASLIKDRNAVLKKVWGGKIGPGFSILRRGGKNTKQLRHLVLYIDIELGKSVQFTPFHFGTDKGIYHLELSVYSLAELIEDTDLLLITMKSKYSDLLFLFSLKASLSK